METIHAKIISAVISFLSIKAPILGITFLEAGVLIGVGYWFTAGIERAFRLRGTTDELGISSLGIIGAIATEALAIFWNFFSPLDEIFAGSVLALGLTGGVALFAARRRGFGTKHGSQTANMLVVAAVASLAALLASRVYLAHGDVGLYHIPTIVLDASSSIIIGVANIHMRFGYNSGLYPLAGAFFYPKLKIASAILINSPLTALAAGAMVGSFRWGSLQRRDGMNVALGLFLIVHCVEYSSVASGQGAASTDWPAFMTASYALLLCVQAVSAMSVPPTENYIPCRLWVGCMVGAFALTIKLTQLLVPLLPLIAITAALIRWKARAVRPTAVGLGLAAVLGVLWCARGLLLSGCLVYPVSATCIRSLAWTVAPGTAESDVAYMASFGKVPAGAAPDQVPGFLVWFPAWANNMATYRFIIDSALLLAATIVFLLIRAVLKGRAAALFEELDRVQRLSMLAFFAVLLGNVGVWFFAAPLPRYGEASIYDLCSFTAALAIPATSRRNLVASLVWKSIDAARRRPIFIIWPLLLYVLAADGWISLARRPLSTDWPGLPVASVETVTLPGGFNVFKTLPPNRYCWAASEPCSYYFDPSLQATRTSWWTLIHRPPPKL